WRTGSRTRSSAEGAGRAAPSWRPPSRALGDEGVVALVEPPEDGVATAGGKRRRRLLPARQLRNPQLRLVGGERRPSRVDELLRAGLTIGRRQRHHPREGSRHALGESAVIVERDGDQLRGEVQQARTTVGL